MKFLHKELKWREFEKVCEEIIYSCVDESLYRVDFQRSRTYANGKDLRMDCHIAERRQGGKSLVVDFKHFPVASLHKGEILDTERYRIQCRASAAVIMYSYQSNFTNNFFDIADQYNMHTYEVDFSRTFKVKSMFRRLFSREEVFDPACYLR